MTEANQAMGSQRSLAMLNYLYLLLVMLIIVVVTSTCVPQMWASFLR